MEFLLAALVAFGIAFVLPIVSFVFAFRTRSRVEDLEHTVEAQRDAIERLELRVAQLRREMETRPAAAPAARAEAPDVRPAPAPTPKPIVPTPAADRGVRPVPDQGQTGLRPGSDQGQTGVRPGTEQRPQDPAVALPRPSPDVSDGRPALPRPHVTTPPAPTPVAASSETTLPAHGAPRRIPPPPSPPPPPSEPPAPQEPWFDWESLVGVKLFSAIAGIALVLAAVFFLRYSIEHGWLQPPVRVAIGIVVAIGLLVACELKAARRYPVTANALDAAAIAILFSTFFAAHALWNLIPALVAFGLLAIVTALAVLLSIRRESLFIAVLGLLGGFATPALLSTGENRPIPLFAYLMLLNVGLAWVAYRQRWPVLTLLTLVFTTVYQWGWVFKFLTASDLSLAMGIFLIFPIATLVALVLGARTMSTRQANENDAVFEHTALTAAVLPLFFAVYLAAVPEYGARPWLLFGFLFLIDAGLCAIALARKQELLHGAGALATLLVSAVWLALSYSPAGTSAALVSCAAFVVFYLWAPWVATRVGRPFQDAGLQASYTAPLLLFVPVVLARVEPRFAAPLPLLATLAALVLLIAWRAAVERRGPLYFIAAFFAIAAQGVWSWQHLTAERLGTAVLTYAAFGLIAIFVPVLARRWEKPLEPVEGGGFVLITSLGLLLSISSSPTIAPVALWGLGLLLAILNAGLFVESAAGRLPLISIGGSLFSWIILGTWWWSAAAAVGVLPSLSVLVGLTLITLGGHAWVRRRVGEDSQSAEFGGGLYLGLIGHVFLLFVATNREWSLPPWPLFGALAVMTLATSAASLVSRAPALHAAGAVAAAGIVTIWSDVAGVEWVMVGLAAAAVVSAYALAWIAVSRRFGAEAVAAAAAAVVLFAGEGTAIVASNVSAPPFVAMLASHLVNLTIVLALTWWQRWKGIALLAVVTAWLALAQFQAAQDLSVWWRPLLVMASALYALFVAYPIVLGERTRTERDPYLTAVLASAMFFVSARAAFIAGGLSGVIGIVPVVEAAVLAVLLRRLLSIETSGARDTARLALVAGASLAFVTVAIPLQLEHQWITIGWALEGAALAWLYRRVPHRGLLYACVALLGAVFVRLALNPSVLTYEPRGEMPILNWYLYAYLIAAAALLVAGYWLAQTNEELFEGLPRPSRLLPAGAVILLFLLLNIEIADYFATERTVMFRFGVSVSQDLTYTIGWLVFGLGLLAVGIYLTNRPARVTAVTLIAVTTFKCFLYDLGSFGGLYRVASLVGLAMSLSLVALALQKYVLARQEERI